MLPHLPKLREGRERHERKEKQKILGPKPDDLQNLLILIPFIRKFHRGQWGYKRGSTNQTWVPLADLDKDLSLKFLIFFKMGVIVPSLPTPEK